jgi:hypothetical protein
MRTINDVFHHLLNTTARFSKSIALIDRNVRLHCSSWAFLEWLQKTYTRTTLIQEQTTTSCDDVCLIDSCMHCGEWRDLLPAKPLRVLEDPFVGHCKIYQVPDGLVLYQADGWVVCRSTQGSIVFLHEGQLETGDLNQWPNPTGLISILFSEILARSGKWLVHAAGVGHQGRCHVWTGHSGTGKTTRTLAHVTHGYTFFGDDMVVLGKGDTGQWQVWPFWRPLHVTRHTCELLPVLAGVTHSFSENNKSSVEITDLFVVSPPSTTPLESIWILSTDDNTAPRRLDSQEAFAMLSQTFMHGFWPETTQANLEALLDIVFQIPVFIMTRSAPLTLRVDELYALANSNHEPAA